jgi:hypothetical protein
VQSTSFHTTIPSNMADTAFLDEVGLSNTTLFPSMGATAAANMRRVIAALSPSSPDTKNTATKRELAKMLKLWATCAPADTKVPVLHEHVTTFYKLIGELAVAVDEPDTVKEGEDFEGNAFIASTLASTLHTAGQMDPTQELTRKFSPLAFNTLEAFLNTPDLVLGNKPIMLRNETLVTVRTELASVLVKTMPYSGTVELPNAFPCITKLLLWKNVSPGHDINGLKQGARQVMSQLTAVCKSALAHSGAEILELVKAGGNDQLLTQFISDPEIYANNPQAVHDNLDIFMRQNYMMMSTIFNNVAGKDASVLIPHVQYFVNQLSQTSNMALLTLMILVAIAKEDPVMMYTQHTTAIWAGSATFPANSSGVLSNYIAAVAGASTAAADDCLVRLVELLERGETAMFPMILSNISNVMKLISSINVLLNLMPRIAKFRSASEVLYTSIDDFAAGRSLETLTNRVDILDAKINALNSKVAETCSNMADVIAYVDANMADMKDFLAEVVKKLPKPKRLEVVGTLRKTLILHFECVNTGYEYGITSTEWSKWLKMGFSLVKAGQAIIDIGMGNPLGILKKGVECVQEIYSAYKTEDDDEFNSYITNPFLTSAEQDQLLEKLRGQGFFEIFDYDNQKAGWFMKTPEKHGKLAAGEHGSVSKVWKKEGDSMINTEALTAFAGDYIQNDALNAAIGYTQTALGVASAGAALASVHMSKKSNDSRTADRAEAAEAKTPGASSDDAHSPMHHQHHHAGGTGAHSPASGPAQGSRAAALREGFGPAASASAEEKLAQANMIAAQQKKIAELEMKVAALETKYTGVTRSIEELRSQKSSCACVIC